MITARLEEKPVLKAVVTKPYQGKGYAEGYEVGHAQGYTEGETAATEAAEAANAVILADCNAVLPTKGASTAETLEQVPHRILEIKSPPMWLPYMLGIGRLFYQQTFPTGTELELNLDVFNGYMDTAFYQAKGLKKLKLTANSQTNVLAAGQSFAYCADLEELDLSGIPLFKFTNATNFCLSCTKLHTVLGVVDYSGATHANMWAGCSALKHIRILAGSISTSQTFVSCADLDAESRQSIVDGFADMTGQTAITLTVHKTVGEKMTEAQKATLTAKNVTLVIK